MDMFTAERVSMDVLVEMTHESLKDIGVSAYGHRHKILRGIKDLQARIPERKKQKPTGSCRVFFFYCEVSVIFQPQLYFSVYSLLVQRLCHCNFIFAVCFPLEDGM